MIEKRYQVFVSSTYQDLQIERQEIIQALLELDCIPSGMELFPAANEDQWTLIKRVIDDCDYYIVVIAGRYGSIGPEGLSYTEMEYRYALEQKKPIIAFLHKEINKLPFERVETSAEARAKLESFIGLAKKKMVRFWETPTELGSVVSRSVIQLIKNSPAKGWVRADLVPSESAAQEILRLRNELEELRAESRKRRSEKPAGTDELAQGEESAKLRGIVTHSKEGDYFGRTRTYWDFELTWNSLFGAIAPQMMDEATGPTLLKRINDLIRQREIQKIEKAEFFKKQQLREFEISPESFDTIIVQLVALGLIEKSIRPRSVKDNATYWKLSPYGEKIMYELRAIKQHPNNAKADSFAEEEEA